MANVWDGHNCGFYLASEEKIETPKQSLSGGLPSDTELVFHSNKCRPLNQVI